jgi:uncharacterized protein
MILTTLKKGNDILIPKASVARNFVSRFMGLMGKKGIAKDEALVFPKCNSVHTFFMRFPIDVVFVGKDGVVTDIIEAMAPWRMCLPRLKAAHTIELDAFRSKELGLSPGVRLECREVWS